MNFFTVQVLIVKVVFKKQMLNLSFVFSYLINLSDFIFIIIIAMYKLRKKKHIFLMRRLTR